MCIHEYPCIWIPTKARKGSQIPGADTAGCEWTEMSAENSTQGRAADSLVLYPQKVKITGLYCVKVKLKTIKCLSSKINILKKFNILNIIIGLLLERMAYFRKWNVPGLTILISFFFFFF